MKFCLLLFVSVMAFYSCIAQDCIKDSRTGIIICFSAEGRIFPESAYSPEINPKAISLDSNDYSISKKVISVALSKYPISVLKKNLKIIYVLKYLELYGVQGGGTNCNDAIYLSTEDMQMLYYNSFYLEQLFHAEFSSILLRNYKQFFNEKKWKESNAVNVNYGTGGVEELRRGKGNEDFREDLNKIGILDQYALSSVENDFNSFAKNIFLPKPGFWELTDTFPSIRAKKNMIIDFYNRIDTSFTEKKFKTYITPEKKFKPSLDLRKMFKRAYLLYNKNDNKNALIVLDSLLSFEPNNHTYLEFKGIASARLGNFDTALVCLQSSLGKTKSELEKAHSLYSFSNYFALKGEPEFAVSYLKKSIDLGMTNYKAILEDPDFEKIKNDTGFIALQNELKLKLEQIKIKQNEKTSFLENIKTFSKLYGYVRYFHPSDEAAKIDWNKFAVYGINEVENAYTKKELVSILIRLFKPIAPSILIYSVKDSIKFDLKNITPPNVNEYKEVYWQHLGLGDEKHNSDNQTYKSIRINRLTVIQDKSNGDGTGFCSVVKKIDAVPYIGKEFEFTAYVKMGSPDFVNGYLWTRIDKDTTSQPGNTLFFDNMYNRPITSGKWQKYTVRGKIDNLAKYIYFGSQIVNRGDMFVDNMKFSVKDENGEFEEIFSDGFESDAPNMAALELSKGIGMLNSNSIYSGTSGRNTIVTNEHFEGKNGLKLSNNLAAKMVSAEPLFNFKPSIDKPFYSDLGNGIHCVIPLVVYGTNNQTYPAADTLLLNDLIEKMKNQYIKPSNDMYLHFADLTVYYTAMQHFFPNMEITKTNWEEAFNQALNESSLRHSDNDFLLELKRFAAKLGDWQEMVYPTPYVTNPDFAPSIQVEWIENKLIVTKNLKNSSDLPIGTEVKKIENLDSKKYYDSVALSISAITKGCVEWTLNTNVLCGPYLSKLPMDVVLPDGKKKSVALSRTLSMISYYSFINTKTTWRKIDTSTYYINIGQISNLEIDSLLPELIKTKYIICDLRGYSFNKSDFITHLLTINDTTKTWLKIPQIIYPNYNVSGYKPLGWDLKAKDPHLKAKIVFITDGSTAGYTERYLGFIKGSKYATIVGQPTAGASGEINTVSLPGGYNVSFTGMNVLKQNGSQFFCDAFVPDILINKTIKGVIKGKDEFLEKAIEICK